MAERHSSKESKGSGKQKNWESIEDIAILAICPIAIFAFLFEDWF